METILNCQCSSTSETDNMILRLFVCSVLIFHISQANSEKKHPLEVSYEKWIRGKIEKLNTQVQEAHDALKNDIDSLIHESTEEIGSIADMHVSFLKSSNVEKKCLEEGLSQLDEVKNDNVRSILTCLNLSLAMEDVAVIGFDVLNFAAKTVVYLDNILNGLSDCTWKSFLPPLRCYFDFVNTAMAEMPRFVLDVKELLKSVAEVSVDIKNQINYCKEGLKKPSSQMAQNIVTKTLQCTRFQ